MDNLDLIDWRMVGFAALWIAGLAVVVSALGFADYHAAAGRRRFREEAARPGFSAALNFGFVLFCLGMTGSTRAWWETALWVLLAAAFAAYCVQALRRTRRGE